MKKKILRKCVVSHEQLPKKELLRVVANPDGNIYYDETGRLNGRGAYLKKDREIIEKAQRNQLLDRALRRSVPDSIYEELIDSLDSK